MLKDTFGSSKPIIAMVHLPLLPGTALYDRDDGMAKIIDTAERDIEALQAGGADAIMFGNEGDRPYVTLASPQTLVAMPVTVGELKPLIKVPLGVNYLWDAMATVALGVAAQASFAREIFTGVYDSDTGLWEAKDALGLYTRVCQYRRQPRQCRGILADRRRLRNRHPFQGRRPYLERR